jgi:flavin-dependent dehydrogenase
MGRRHDGAALEAEIQVSSQALEKWRNGLLFDFGSIPWGYAWIFPKNEHLSIGVGTWRASSKLKLHDYLDRFIEKQPDLKGSMVTKGHLLPLGGRVDRFDSGRVVLAGDAAATADPLTGEGIAHAIHSAILAAEEIGAAFARGDTNLSNYSRRVNKAINADFRFARVATNIFYRWPRHSYQAFIEDGGLLEPTTGIMEGTMSYRRLIIDTLMYSPRLFWRTLKKQWVRA